jgi:hypothetical protein
MTQRWSRNHPASTRLAASRAQRLIATPEYIVWGLNKEITATYTYPDGVTTVQRQGWIYWDLIEDDED